MSSPIQRAPRRKLREPQRLVLGPLYGIEIRLVHLSTCDEAGPATSGGGRVERVFHRASRGSRRKERLRACPRPGDGPAFPAPARRIRSSVLAVLFGTLNSVLAYSRYYSSRSPHSARGLSNREVAISLDLATKCSDARIGRKQDAVSVINRRSRRASLAAPHLIPRLTHVP